MKKRICMMMTVVMTVSVLALAGCGGGGSKTAESKAPQATEAVTEAPTEAVTEASADAANGVSSYTTIREYLEDPAVAEQIEEVEKNSSNESLTLEIEAEGDNTLFYKCTYTEDYNSEQAALITKALEESLNSEDYVKQMTDVIDTIESSSLIRGLQIKSAYYLPDGTLLAERTLGGE